MVRKYNSLKDLLGGDIVSPSGKSSFGWDPIFRPKGYQKTYEEMTSKEKNNISHRGKAFLKLKNILDMETKT